MTTSTAPSSTSPPARQGKSTAILLLAALLVGGLNAILAIAVLFLQADTRHAGFALWFLGTLTLVTGLALCARALAVKSPAGRALCAPSAANGAGAFANRLLLRASLETGKCACLAIGIDNFEHLAKTHGPNTAEAMLRTVADVFNTKLRASDIVGRAYDSIFAVVMPNTDPQGADLTANRIRDAVLSGPLIPLANGQTLPITVSVGLSILEDEDTVESLLDRSHQTLQTAQRQGPATILMG